MRLRAAPGGGRRRARRRGGRACGRRLRRGAGRLRACAACGGGYGHCNLLTPRPDRAASIGGGALPPLAPRLTDLEAEPQTFKSLNLKSNFRLRGIVRTLCRLVKSPGIVRLARDRRSLVQQHGGRGATRSATRSGPAAGSDDQLVAGRPHARPQARPLRAEHEHHAARVVRRRCRASARRPRRRRPRRPPRLASPRKSARFRTRATGRCSTAPADARQTAGVTCAARRSGITTPVAPGALGAAADRRRGSAGPGPGRARPPARPRARAARAASAYGYGLDLGTRRPGGRASRTVARARRGRDDRHAASALRAARAPALARRIVRPPTPAHARCASPAQRLAARRCAPYEDHPPRACGPAPGPRACRAPRSPRSAARRAAASARVEVAVAPARLLALPRQAQRLLVDRLVGRRAGSRGPSTVEHLGERRAAPGNGSPGSSRRLPSLTSSNSAARACGVLKSSRSAAKNASRGRHGPSGAPSPPAIGARALEQAAEVRDPLARERCACSSALRPRTPAAGGSGPPRKYMISASRPCRRARRRAA